MPRHTIGPFPALSAISELVLAEDKLLQLQTVFKTAGCRCNGESAGRVRDHDWKEDLSAFIARSIPHEISVEGEGTVLVSLKLETLRVEIDDNNEICTWLFNES
jgi:hypothetical protein